VLNESTPNTVRLQVVPPGEHNGLDVLGYRVKYDEAVYDFDAGFSRGVAFTGLFLKFFAGFEKGTPKMWGLNSRRREVSLPFWGHTTIKPFDLR